MDQQNISIKQEDLTDLPLEEERLKKHVKTEFYEDEDCCETDLYFIENEIKSEVLDINDCSEFQDVTERPSAEMVPKWHEKMHNKQLPVEKVIYRCNKCSFKSDWSGSLQRHLKVHSDTYYKCTECDFITKYKESLSKHQSMHKSPSKCKIFVCDECEFQTKLKLSLKQHKLTHRCLEEVEQFKCTHCKFVTKYQYSINNHILTIHKNDEVEKHKCPECEFSTYHKFSLKRHRLIHRKPGEGPMYKCGNCPYKTKSKAFLTSHMKSHKDSVPCPICQKLITEKGMPLHLRSHESGDVKNRYKCKECPYATLYCANLSRHVKIMHSDKRAIDYKFCSECPFKTFENARLKRHMQEIHSLEAPKFKCEECKFTSKFNSCVKRHVATAHGDKNPETCPVCFKPSANVYALRKHLELHRSEDEVKMFQCEDCPYKTRNRGTYKYHLLRHKSPNEVPMYKCTNCSFQSKTKRHLLDHIARFSDPSQSENKVTCPRCCYKTSDRKYLRIHMSKVHRNQMDPNEFWHCTLCDFKTLNKKVLKNHKIAHKKGDVNLESEGIDNVPDQSSCEAAAIQEMDTTRSENLEDGKFC